MSEIERWTGESPIVPLSEQQREVYPHVIYQQETISKVDGVIFSATLLAAQNAGLQVVADLEYNQDHGTHVAEVRSGAEKRWDIKADSALVHGLTTAVTKGVAELEEKGLKETDLPHVARSAADAIIGQITGNPGLYEAFRTYYGGLRWGTDQEKFTADLFIHGTDYDPQYIESHLTSSYVSHLIHELNIEIPWEKRREWHELKADEILAQVPEINYRRLEDDKFRQSPEGQHLEQSYKKLCGYILAQEHKTYPRPITEDGKEIPKPVIPLTRFPIIEALMIDEVSQSRPTAKYDMGPQEVVDLILESDSLAAQLSLVASLTSRLPRDQRHVFDGPDEFQHKRYTIRSLMGSYERASTLDRRNQFKQHLLSVFEAYTDDGAIADSVREQHRSELRAGYDWHRETDEVKGIVSDILTITLASPDAESFISRYLPDFEKGLATEPDPLALDAADLMFVVLDALKKVDADSRPEIFELVGRKVFRESSLAAKLREFAALRAKASELWRTPEVLLARKGLRRFSYSLSNEKNPEKEAADQAYKEAVAPAETIANEAREGINRLLIDYLGSLVEKGQLGKGNRQITKLFEGLVTRINFGDTHHMETLPWEYTELLKLAEHPNIPDKQKGNILWRFAEHLNYTHEQSQHLLVPVILDIYRVMLGPIGSVRLPSAETYLGLYAANHIASHNAVFKKASEDELLTLAHYKGELLELIGRVASGAFLTASEEDINPDNQSFEDWQQETLKNLKDVAREMAHLEEQYKEYLHIEKVKVEPSVYYPWVLEKLVPFWRKMQWEVSPGNQPNADIRDLYSMLEHHIQSRLVIQEDDYPEDFDLFSDGHLDTLLLECYRRMVVPHDIKYNTTVWQDGLSFVHNAVALMPKAVMEQFRQKYPHEKSFLEYLEKSRARWNKDEAKTED